MDERKNLPDDEPLIDDFQTTRPKIKIDIYRKIVALSTPDRTLHITKLAFVESLRELDGHTAEDLAKVVAAELAAAGAGPVLEVFRCGGLAGFREIVARLVEEAERGKHHPLLPIECHGDETAGLEFADGSKVSWQELMSILRPLNVATELGLIVVVAACWGGSAIDGVNLTQPAPCFALIGPSGGLWSNELFDALRVFYLDVTLVRTPTDRAVETLRKAPLEDGGFLVLSMHEWFRRVIVAYLKEKTSSKELKAQALRQYIKARAEGMAHLDMSYWKRHYLRTMPKFLREYHGRFFMTERLPHQAPYFAKSLRDVEDELKRRGFTG